ncbi:uncharacterized protein JCM15063_004815 [Sporobolomyces koalae]|uniref:uncharacterized protein n=1 Tax=Sporobolomyces koalae TaxID=500713 RepID=UPI003170CD4D
MDLADIPPITKAYLIGAVATSAAVQCNLVTPLQLYFTYRSAFHHMQLWRVVTCFLYWGPLSLDFFFHVFFIMRYSKMLEESTFHGKRAEYVWLLIVSCSFLLILSPLSPSPFLSSPLSFTLVYLWSRMNPSVRLSLFGLLTITAPYLPYALCLFSWILSSGGGSSMSSSHQNGAGGGGGWGLGVVISDLLGIATGHWWYFWTTVWKRERSSGGRDWLECPLFLVRLLDSEQRVEELRQNEIERRRILRERQAVALEAERRRNERLER